MEQNIDLDYKLTENYDLENEVMSDQCSSEDPSGTDQAHL